MENKKTNKAIKVINLVFGFAWLIVGITLVILGATSYAGYGPYYWVKATDYGQNFYTETSKALSYILTLLSNAGYSLVMLNERILTIFIISGVGIMLISIKKIILCFVGDGQPKKTNLEKLKIELNALQGMLNDKLITQEEFEARRADIVAKS